MRSTAITLCINKLGKLRPYVNVGSKLGEEEKFNPSFKLSATSRQDVIDRIEEGYDVFKTSQYMTTILDINYVHILQFQQDFIPQAELEEDFIYILDNI